MKRLSIRLKYMISALLITSAVLVSGCSSSKDESGDGDTDAAKKAQTIEEQKDDVTDEGIKPDAVIMVVGDANITYSEVMVYVMMLKEQYEPVFTNNIWSFSVDDDKSFEDMAKDEIINQIARLKIMGFESDSLGVSLNADEKLEIEDDAVEFLQGVTMDDQKKYGITQKVVETIYTDNYLAQKVFDVATADVNTKVSDEDAIAVKVKQIKIAFKGADRNGKELTGSDEEKKTAKKRMDKIYEAVVTNGKDFDYYADKYSDGAEKTVTLIKGEMEQAYEEAAFSLGKKEYSAVVTGKNAYYLLYCVNNADKSNLEANKEKIISSRQDDSFSKTYSEWLGKYDTYIVTKLWNMISFSEIA